MTFPPTGGGAELPHLSLPTAQGPLLSLGPDGVESDGTLFARTLLAFVPYAFTPVCTAEIGALAALAPRLRAVGVEPVVLSCDAKYSLRVWAEHEIGDGWADGALLASDFWPHGAAAQALGAFDEVHGGPTRTAVLLDGGAVAATLTAEFSEQRDFAAFCGLR